MDIVVLCGGLGAERDVSISGAAQVASALKGQGHRAVLVDLFFGYTGQYGDPKEIFEWDNQPLFRAVGEEEPDLAAVKASRVQDNDSLMGDNVLEVCRAADMVFLVLHGDEGENGKLQATLDIAGIRYTGAGYLGSALAMNKRLTKTLLAAGGVACPAGITLQRGEAVRDVGFPCVVKPCSGGSSVGTSIVQAADEYESALALAFVYEDEVVVEQYIKGRELTMGILGGKAMPSIEIIPKTGFYDYKNKYQEGATLELCPAPVPEEIEEAMRELSLRVGELLMIDVYYRVDYIMDDSGALFCLEANTLPGMTPTSLVPRAAQTMGMSFGALCDEIIRLSMEKYQ